mgnify:CR=1 FL=1
MRGSFFVCEKTRQKVFRREKSADSSAKGGNFYKEVPLNMATVSSRVKITLACSECKQRNYDTMKNKKNDPDRIEISKYCRFCRKHTVHRETR